MLRKIIIAALGLGTLFFGVTIGYQFINSGFAFESINIRLVLAFFTGIIALSRILVSNRRPKVGKAILAKEYNEVIGTTFSNNDAGYALLLKALSFFNNGKYNRTISLLKRLLQKCESSKEQAIAYLFLGLCYDDFGQLASAKESYKLAIQNDPNLDTAYSNLGLIHKKSGDFKTAVQLYEKAIAVNKENSFAYNNLAATYIDALEPDKAIEYAMEALKLKANMYQAMNTLALAYSLKNEEKMAEDYYQRSVVNGCQNPDTLRRLMQNMYTKGLS